jgi:hypothetical protein
MRVRDAFFGESMASEASYGHPAYRAPFAGPPRLLINSLKLLIIPIDITTVSENLTSARGRPA